VAKVDYWLFRIGVACQRRQTSVAAAELTKIIDRRRTN